MTVRPATRDDGDTLALLASRDPTTARPFTDYDKARMAQLMEGGSPGVFARIGEDAAGVPEALCWLDVNPHEQEVVIVWLLPLERSVMPKLLRPFKAALAAAEAAWPQSRDWLVYGVFPENPEDPLQAQMIAATWKSAVSGTKVYSASNLRGSDTFEPRNLEHLRASVRGLSRASWLIWMANAGMLYDVGRTWPS